MVKRVDIAVYNALMDAKDGKFTGGVQSLGLAENGASTGRWTSTIAS